MFLGNPKDQTLTDPQGLNSYSYANDNPIVKSDPQGKFAAALAPVMYGLGDLGLASTVEFWGPPVTIGTAGTAVGVAAYNAFQNRGNYYPGPGMDYQTSKLATENASRMILNRMEIGRVLEAQLLQVPY